MIPLAESCGYSAAFAELSLENLSSIFCILHKLQVGDTFTGEEGSLQKGSAWELLGAKSHLMFACTVCVFCVSRVQLRKLAMSNDSPLHLSHISEVLDNSSCCWGSGVLICKWLFNVKGRMPWILVRHVTRKNLVISESLSPWSEGPWMLFNLLSDDCLSFFVWIFWFKDPA